MELLLGLAMGMGLVWRSSSNVLPVSDTLNNRPASQQQLEDPSPQQKYAILEETVSKQESRIELNLRPLHSAEDRDPIIDFGNAVVEISVEGDFEEGSQEGTAWRFLTDFDSGTVRLLQESPGSRHRVTIPLDLCPGEHVVSVWAIGPSDSLFSTSMTFVTSKHKGTTANPVPRKENVEVPLAIGDIARPIASSSGDDDSGGGGCDEPERKPSLLGQGGSGHKPLCRVCPYFIGDKESSSTPSYTYKRLLLRTSLKATFGAENEQAQRIVREWPIELREGDSAASAARKFASVRLGFDVRLEATASEFGRASKDTALQENRKQVVKWITHKLESELAERQIRRNLKRSEATATMSRTGQLRIVLGAGQEDSAPPHNGWLVTDVNTLDVTDPADFEYILGPDGLADAFLAEHVLEHLSLQDAHHAARNCHRFLRPGGRMRIAVPDPNWFTFMDSSSARSRDNPHEGTTTLQTPATSAERRKLYLPELEKSVKTEESRGGALDEEGVSPLPEWLRQAMLATPDWRDGHRVQFSSELLANVCWSAGLTPVHIEGGDHLPSSREASTAMAKEREYEGAVEGRKMARTHDGDKDGMVTRSDNLYKSTDFSSEAPKKARIEKGEALEENLWGRIKRSASGGDPRGSVSIVMDCIKERVTAESATHKVLSRKVPAIALDLSPERGAGGEMKGVKLVNTERNISSSLHADSDDVVLGGRLDLRPKERSSQRTDETSCDVPEEKLGLWQAGNTLPQTRKTAIAIAEPAEVTIADEPQPNRSRMVAKSLEQWAAASREDGKVEPSLMSSKYASKKTPTTSDQQVLSKESPSSLAVPPESVVSTNGVTGRGELSANELALIHVQTREAFSAGNFRRALELCEIVLRQSPSDGVALLYQGAVMAQNGELDMAWKNMDRLLDLSYGVHQNIAASKERVISGGKYRERTDADIRAVEVPPDITVAAATNLALLARARAPKNLDENAEIFFLVEGLRGIAEREKKNSTMLAAGNTEAETVGAVRTPSEDVRDSVRRVNGFVDVLVMVAQAFEKKGQLTSALRLYQRAILLGGTHDQRVLHGLSQISRRLLQVRRDRHRRVPTSATFVTPPPVDGKSRPKISSAVGQGCDWSIAHPRSGQVFPPGGSIGVEYDLTHLDLGLPSAGSLFKTAVGGSFTAETEVQGIADSLGVVVCSYLESFKAANCLISTHLHGTAPGWHVLTAEAHQLPSLEPLSCSSDAKDRQHSTRTVRFCVGDIVTCEEGLGGKQAVSLGETSKSPGLDDSLAYLDRTVPVSPPTANEEIIAPGTHRKRTTLERIKKSAQVTENVELPFCFMTVALNAMPFITHHAPTFREVGKTLSNRAAEAILSEAAIARNISSSILDGPINSAAPPPEAFWEWHIVEGVAADRAELGSPYTTRTIPDRYFDRTTGLSVDGTTQYLDSMVNSYGRGPEVQRVHVHRRCEKVRPDNRKDNNTVDKMEYTDDDSSADGRSSFESSPQKGKGSDGQEVRGLDRGKGDGGMVRRTSCLWRDEIQMMNTIAFSLERECLLVQIGAEELWTAKQLVELRDMFLLERKDGENAENQRNSTEDHQQTKTQSVGGSQTLVGSGTPDYSEHMALKPKTTSVEERTPMEETRGEGSEINGRVDGHRGSNNQQQRQHEQEQSIRQQQAGRNRQCAYFDCYFFVGPNLVTVTENGWGHSTLDEWLRAWVFRPRESLWINNALPTLATPDENDGWRFLNGDECIGREETRAKGLIFTHYAYVFEDQVRFKDELYGHSEPPPSQQRTEGATTDTIGIDAVVEWRAMQSVQPPILLADHLTWLRVQGRGGDSRLLTTVADRPGSGTRGNGSGGTPEYRFRATGERDYLGEATSQPASFDVFFPAFPPVPLAPFLLMVADGEEAVNAAARSLQHEHSCGTSTNKKNSHITKCDEPKTRRHALTHDTDTRMREDWGEKRRPGGEGGSGGAAITAADSSVACASFHLLVDGVMFQVGASGPRGILRVWTNILPAMLNRLREFEGTCLTLLVRSLAAPPQVIEEAFIGLPSNRFSLVHVPLCTFTSGFMADRLMLSWAVRSSGATAFISTLYTQPFWATTPSIVRPLLIHDLLPEILGWNMSTGEWLEKVNAVDSASAVVTISRNSARNFLRIYPPILRDNGVGDGDSYGHPKKKSRPVWASHNAVDTKVFYPVVNGNDRSRNLEEFRRAAGLGPETPYVMIVGSRLGYKNALHAYHALGLAGTSRSSSPRISLVLVGGGPVKPKELKLLDGVGSWSHIGSGSTGDSINGSVSSPNGAGGVAVDDALLAVGYSGAVALLHLSGREGFGLTVLEAFACGCPVIAADIPSVREIAGLLDLDGESTTTEPVPPPLNDKSPKTAPTLKNVAPVDDVAQHQNTSWNKAPDSRIKTSTSPEHESLAATTAAANIRTKPLRETLFRKGRYDSALSSQEGGLILIENPGSATQIWRAIRALMAMSAERRAFMSEALVQRAQVFDSWQPLADKLLQAAID